MSQCISIGVSDAFDRTIPPVENLSKLLGELIVTACGDVFGYGHGGSSNVAGYLLVKQFERFVLYCKFTNCFHKNKFLIHIIPDFCIRKIPIFANERGYNVFNHINCRYEI